MFGAGSLIVPFDALEAAFEAQYPQIDLRAEYHGSIQVIRHATELHEPIDVVATADASLIPMLMTGVNDPETGRPYADWYIRFASNRLALAYNQDSKYAAELTADNWPEVLARPDVKVGIADPRFDAAGYRAFMAVVLAQERAGGTPTSPDLFKDQFTQPVTLFLDDNLATVTVPEVLETRSGAHVMLRGASIQLIALLESGDLDYAFEYESVIRQHGLEMLRLPDEVNLGSAEHEADYGRVQVNLDFRRFATVKPKFRGERIGYGITIPRARRIRRKPASSSPFSSAPKAARSWRRTTIRCSRRRWPTGTSGCPPSCRRSVVPGDTVSRRSALDIFFGLAGGVLLLFLVAPLASTLFSTTPTSFWDTLH